MNSASPPSQPRKPSENIIMHRLRTLARWRGAHMCVRRMRAHVAAILGLFIGPGCALLDAPQTEILYAGRWDDAGSVQLWQETRRTWARAGGETNCVELSLLYVPLPPAAPFAGRSFGDQINRGTTTESRQYSAADDARGSNGGANDARGSRANDNMPAEQIPAGNEPVPNAPTPNTSASDAARSPRPAGAPGRLHRAMPQPRLIATVTKPFPSALTVQPWTFAELRGWRNEAGTHFWLVERRSADEQRVVFSWDATKNTAGGPNDAAPSWAVPTEGWELSALPTTAEPRSQTETRP